jgi:hypothetical protein
MDAKPGDATAPTDAAEGRAASPPSEESAKSPFAIAIEADPNDVEFKRSATSDAVAHMGAYLGYDKAKIREIASSVVGRPVTGTRDLAVAECDQVLFALRGLFNEKRHTEGNFDEVRRHIMACEIEAIRAGIDALEGARNFFRRYGMTSLDDLTREERLAWLAELRKLVKTRRETRDGTKGESDRG